MQHALISKSPKRLTLTRPADRGFLIAFEGLDGSGKSTQRKLLKSWLKSMHEDVVVTKWSSSPRLKQVIKEKKAAHSLDPATYAVLHASDFWYRYETVIEPALSAGRIVLADRYVFTGVARDRARGIDPDWSAELYENARRPDIVFYFTSSVETCAQRIASSRPIKFYEAGQDVTGMDDAFESFLYFSSRVASIYNHLSRRFGFVTVDAEQSIYDQHRFIRETYLSLQPETPAPYLFEPQSLLSQVDV